MDEGNRPIPLASIMSEASAEMRHSLAKVKAALSHNLSKGEAAEETVRTFFRRYLPTSLGVTTGQVIDSLGQRSKQTDIIIYDKVHTPVLFTSEESGHQLVPSEGVLAAVEVKSHVNPSDVAGIVDNMVSLKSLDKSAYFPSGGVIKTEIYVHGLTYDHFPTLYFLFAFDAGSLPVFAAEFHKQLAQLPVNKRVDCACILAKGVLLNAKADGTFDTVPGPDTILAAYPTDNSLLLFYLLVTRYLLQAVARPIELRRYIPVDWAF